MKQRFVCGFALLASILSTLAGADNPSGGKTEQNSHWSYRRPRKVTPPQFEKAAGHNPIDRFILAKLEPKGLSPVEAVDRATLLRRVYFDLIGLPPSPEQIDEFLKDDSLEAFGSAVDALLASPHFGERWGRHWLDVVRYGESLTLRGFVFNEAWRYRDYVIEALNQDRPYNRFLQEQIAGDLLSADSLADQRRQRIATTFLVLGNVNLEEQDKKQLDMDVVDEQLDTIGKAFLAQTIGCARCHDHKFDPIPTRDYYAMAGILRNAQTLEHANVSKWLELPLPVEPEQERIYSEHEAAVAALQAQIKEAKERLAKLSGSAIQTASKGMPIAASALPGIVVDDSQASRVGDWVHSQYSRSYIGDGYLHDGNSDKGKKTLTFQADAVPAGRYDVRLAYTHAGNRAARVPVSILHADGENIIYVNEQEVPPIEGRFVSLGQFRFEANGQGYVLISNEDTKGHVIADAVQFLPLDKLESPLAKVPDPARSEAEEKSVQAKMAAENEVKRLEAMLKERTEKGPKRPLYMSVKEGGQIGDLRVHKRGSVHSLGDLAPRGFLQVASASAPAAIPEGHSGRLELAEWLANPSNPLTARVMVNRVWGWLTGAGLVRTTDNFGTTGEAPSHPELLDYLAIRFMEEGWSIKKLVRQIVLSRTYQLSSAAQADSPALLKAQGVDPENRLLWRMNRRRLEAESIRDAILFVSGQLQHEMGGSSITPGTSADYGYKYTDKRRSVYVPVFRNELLDLFELFDFADPSMVTGRRNSSTIAPQALFFMNHPFVMEQAEHAAKRFLALPAREDRDRVEIAYRMLLGRSPTAGEEMIALKYLKEPIAAAGKNSQSEQVQAWTEFCQALFASVDFRYVN